MREVEGRLSDEGQGSQMSNLPLVGRCLDSNPGYPVSDSDTLLTELPGTFNNALYGKEKYPIS